VLDYSTAGQVAQRVAEKVLADGLPEGVLLNVNVPYRTYDQIKGYLLTRQGLRLYRDALVRREDPRGHPYYWIGGDPPTGVSEDGTDFGALREGYVSITPLQLDLTSRPALETMQDWQWDHK
jgi:5'-nucleotidase